jgi:hypothetical protein
MSNNKLEVIKMSKKRRNAIFPGFFPQVLVTGAILFVGLMADQIWIDLG